jgi:hypothetical protein
MDPKARLLLPHVNEVGLLPDLRLSTHTLPLIETLGQDHAEFPLTEGPLVELGSEDAFEATVVGRQPVALRVSLETRNRNKGSPIPFLP